MRMKNFDFFAKGFTLKILMLSLCGMLFSCADIGERDNPADPGFRGTLESEAHEIGEVDSDDDLPVCSSEHKGEMVYVKESSQTYFCTGSEWKVLNGAEDNTPISYGTLTDSRDGQTYKTVTIGKQTWMAANLNYNYNKGSASSCYDDDEDNCDKYGRLYTWYVAMKVCPEGWHLPNDDEWETLFEFVGGEVVAGRALKSTSGWKISGNGTDSFGFSALPAGFRNYDGGFDLEGYDANFWSSTENYSDYAYYWGFNCYAEHVLHESYYEYRGFSVRCLRDS